MFSFLNALFPENTEVPKKLSLSSHTIKYGITAKISMWIKGKFGQVYDERKNAFLGNSTSLLGVAEGRLIIDVGIFDGISSTVVGVDGSPDINLVSAEMAKLHASRAEVMRHREMVEDIMDKLNVSAVCYNMLRLYLIKTYGHLRYRPNDNYYDNGHIAVTNLQTFGNKDTGKLVNAVTFDDNPAVSYIKDNMISSKATLFYDMGLNVNPAVRAVLKYAHSKWINNYPFLMAHSSPMLCESYVFVNGRADGEDMEWGDLTPNMIKSVIGEFVRRHACYRDFEVAYNMVCSVLTKPVARSAEAILWNKVTSDILIATPFCVRGLMPELYSNTLYVRSPDWQDTFSSWFTSPCAIVAHSAAFMEAVYTELFHITRVTTGSEVDRDTFMYSATSLTNIPNTGILVDFALTCMRYGRTFEYPYAIRSGVDRMSTIPSLTVEPPMVTVKDTHASETYKIGQIEAGNAPLTIDAYAPITFPSLTYGVNADDYYMNGMKEELEFMIRGTQKVINFYDPREFSNFMSMMRLFGYDVVATRAHDQKRIYNWADNASGRYIYVHDPNDLGLAFSIRVADITKREYSWIELPALYDKIQTGYSLSDVRLTWFSGNERIGFGEPAAPVVSRTQMLEAVAKLAQSRPTIRIVPLVRRSDFLDTRISLPASRPVLVPPLLRQPVVLLDQEPTVPVDSAEAGEIGEL